MGFIDSFLALFGRGRGGGESGEELLVPGPLGTKELGPKAPTYGRLGGAEAVERLREQNIQKAREQQKEESKRDHALESRASTFSRRVREGTLFGGKTSSSVRRLEKGVEEIESAGSSRKRQFARWRFRHKVLPKLEKRAQGYFEREVSGLAKEHESELRRLQNRGASEREIRLASLRFQEKERRLKDDVDRRLGRPLRGLGRLTGKSGSGWRPKF